MATNLAIDQLLLEQAQELGQHRTKKETVNAALTEYIQRRKQLQLATLFGTIEYAPRFDYKKGRKRK